MQTREADPVASLPASAVLPFTAPRLSGARVRLHDGELDYVLPNPSGGRGAYVAPWSMIEELGAPTLHDAVLARRLRGLGQTTPLSVRPLAREVAREGYAGRAAAAAALRAQQRLSQRARHLWAAMLSGLGTHDQDAALDPSRLDPARLAARIVPVSRQLDCTPTALSNALTSLADGFAGLGTMAHPGRLPRLVGLLEELAEGLADEVRRGSGPGLVMQRILGRLGTVHGEALPLLRAARLALADPAALLLGWRLHGEAALEPVVALEVLLDGWDRVALLWRDAATLTERLGLIPELGRLVRASEAGEAPSGSERSSSERGSPERGASERGVERQRPAVPVEMRTGVGSAMEAAEAAGGGRPADPILVIERNERVRARELVLEAGDE